MSGRPAHGPIALLAAALLPVAAGAQGAAAPLPAVELPADWDRRDLEGKWTLYRRDRDANPDPRRAQQWAALLGGRSDFELLEWIVLFEGWRFAGGELARRDAPQTFRAALWNLDAVDTHDQKGARKTLVEDGARALGWLERYAPALQGEGAQLRADLRDRGVRAADPGEKLPPLDPLQVLVPLLDAPAGLAEFGPRLRAEPRVRYVHQVLRGLDGTLVAGRFDAMVMPKVLALASHAEPRVRERAFATLAKLPGALVPWQPLLRTVQQDADPAQRRRAALALSFSSHPRAFFALHEILADPGHPAAETACTRLGDLGDAWTAARLAALAAEAAEGDPARAGLLRAAARRVLARLGANKLPDPVAVRSWLERAAWLRAVDDPRRGEYGAAIAAGLRNRLGAHLGATLDAALQVGVPEPFAGDEAAAVARERAALVAELRR